MTSMTTEPIVTPDQAMLIMVFWTLGAMAIGYGIAVWVYGRRERRRREEESRRLNAHMMALLASKEGDG